MAISANPIPDPTTVKPPRRRRWVPLSLKMFGAILMLFGLASALLIWACYLESQERQREQGFVQQIEGWGGSVVRVAGGSEWLRQFAREDSLIQVQFFERISFIRLDGTATTDAGLAMLELRRLANLEGISLDRTAVTDKGLAHLSRLTNLQELSLDGTAVTDRGLVRLHGLTGLKMLRLTNTRVTDAGIAKLQRALPGLTVYK